MKLLRKFKVNDLEGDLGSDYHFPEERNPLEIAAEIIAEKRSEILFLLGDIFETKEGQDSAPKINELLSEMAQSYQTIFFAPGNHDLRGRDNPWNTFNLPPNVIYPIGNNPIIKEIKNTRILIGNLFYDFNFIAPEKLNLEEKDLRDRYSQLPDGTHFLKGETNSFPEMTETMAQYLTPDIDIIATHAVPHPSQVSFREGDEVNLKELRANHRVINNPEEDLYMAKKEGLTPAKLREYWNIKALLVGSNVLENPEADFKDGLVCLHGHNHQGGLYKSAINGKTVTFISHQVDSRP